MAKPNYIITFSQRDWDALHDSTHKDALAIAASEKDSKIHVDSVARTVKIDDYPFGDFNNIHRVYKNAMKVPANGANQWMDQFGTDAFREEELARIVQSREELRNVPMPDKNPNEGLGLTKDSTAKDGTADILKDNPGVCLGHGHNQGAAYQFLADAVENDKDMFGDDGGMLFIEELPGYLQSEIDAYMETDPEPTWSAMAQSFFDATTKARGLKGPTLLESVLKKAREKKIKVFAIDSGECSPAMAANGAFGEQRTANMNAFGKKVMDQAIKDNPKRKFVVFCGAAHSNTHEGGVPGFSQIYDIPAVILSDDGKIAPHDEDTSLRGMPPKEMQLFVDEFLRAYQEETDAKRIPGGELPLGEDRKEMAVDLARRLLKAGKLPDPKGRSTDELREAVRQAVAKIPKGKAQRYEAGKAALRSGKTEDLAALLEMDPDIAMMRDEGGKTDGQNLLGLATQLGAKNAANSLRGTMTERTDELIADGETVDKRNLAEVIVIKAENTAWGGNEDGMVDVNPKKHKAMVAQLIKTFEQEESESKKNKTPSKLATPATLVSGLSSALATKGGFYKKTDKKWFGTRDPDHVSIDKKKAAKIWVLELAGLGV